MNRATILIVDDDANVRTSARLCLEDAGYIVQQAVNGIDALQRLHDDPPDVMLLDLAMPLMDGMSLIAELRSLMPDATTRIIVVTAQGSVRTAVDAMKLGASDFIEKPFLPEDLRRSVAKVLSTVPHAGSV